MSADHGHEKIVTRTADRKIFDEKYNKENSSQKNQYHSTMSDVVFPTFKSLTRFKHKILLPLLHTQAILPCFFCGCES
jgi:hypothetical protein